MQMAGNQNITENILTSGYTELIFLEKIVPILSDFRYRSVPVVIVKFVNNQQTFKQS